MKPKDLQKLLDQRLSEPEARAAFDFEDLLFTIKERLRTIMEDEGVNRAELARRLGSSKSWITKLLDDSQNVTLWSLFKAARELGLKLDVQLRPEITQQKARWTPAPASVSEPNRITFDSQNTQSSQPVEAGTHELPLAA